MKHKIKLTLLTLITITGLFFTGKYAVQLYLNYKLGKIIKESAKVSPALWEEKYQNLPTKEKYKVVIITNNGGERSYVDYFAFAAKKKGWEVKTYFYQALGHEEQILEFDPDFILFSPYTDNHEFDMRIYAHRSKKYILALSPIQLMVGGNFKKYDLYKPSRPFSNLMSFSHGVLTSSPELGFYKKIFDDAKKPFNGLYILPLAPKMDNEPAEPKTLMWMSGGWDKFRSSKTYKAFINRLAESVPLKVYGHYYAASFLKTGIYDGYIPSSMEVFNTIRDNGIYLLTHSKQHINAGVPTLRVFEAVAANAIVISDKHPFIVKNFGDNFLYFDQNADSEEMFNQVLEHIKWIKNHPVEAKKMAKNAHEIFLQKFTLDKDLNKIAQMHEYVLKQEKEMNLKYPPAY